METKATAELCVNPPAFSLDSDDPAVGIDQVIAFLLTPAAKR